MTASRDPDRLIHEFLLEGEEQLQDQVFDVVRAEIEQKRQRAGFGLWRTPTMNKFLAIGLAPPQWSSHSSSALSLSVRPTAALDVGGDPTATASPEPTPEPTPSPSADAGSASVIADGQEASPEDAYPPITVTLPAGWGIDSATGVVVSDTADAPDGALHRSLSQSGSSTCTPTLASGRRQGRTLPPPRSTSSWLPWRPRHRAMPRSRWTSRWMGTPGSRSPSTCPMTPRSTSVTTAISATGPVSIRSSATTA